MIVTVTLNPAVDKVCLVDSLLIGDVNRIRESSSVAGGKGINVAKVLRQFHLPVACLGFLGGYSGRLIEDTMTKLGAECHFTDTKGDTRTNTSLLGGDGHVTELWSPVPILPKKSLPVSEKNFSMPVSSVSSWCCPEVFLRGCRMTYMHS